MECPFCGARFDGDTCAKCGTTVPPWSPYQSRRATGLRGAGRRCAMGMPLSKAQTLSRLNTFWEHQQDLIDREEAQP
jgi:hypothetical protein